MPATPFSFLDLGTDLIIHILSNLQPKEIICMRETCSTLHAVTQHRSIWIHALCDVMYDAGLPHCNYYPLETITLPWLEHLALLPFKFMNLIEESAKPDEHVLLEPKATRKLSNDLVLLQQLSPVSPHDNADPPIFAEFLPLYGGRYLITIARRVDRFKTFLQFWDLGLDGASPINLLATQVLPYFASLITIIPTKTGTGVYVVVVKSEGPNTTFIAFKLDGITNTSPSQSFLQIGSLKIVTCYIYSPNNVERCLVCLNPDGMYLWDFEQNLVWAWKITYDLDYDLTMVYRYSDVFIIASDDDIFVFDVPDLTVTPNYVPGCELPELQYTIRLPPPCRNVEDDEGRRIHGGNILARNTAQPSPEYFAMFNSKFFHLHEVKPLPAGQRIARRQPVEVGVFELLPFMRAESWVDFGPMQSVKDRVCVGWLDAEGHNFHVTRFPVSPNSTESVTVRLGKGGDHTLSVFGYFYSATGRSCFLTLDGEIFTMEYLNSPSDPLRLLPEPAVGFK